jgi:hypothetical protein
MYEVTWQFFFKLGHGYLGLAHLPKAAKDPQFLLLPKLQRGQARKAKKGVRNRANQA